MPRNTRSNKEKIEKHHIYMTSFFEPGKLKSEVSLFRIRKNGTTDIYALRVDDISNGPFQIQGTLEDIAELIEKMGEALIEIGEEVKCSECGYPITNYVDTCISLEHRGV